ncbi:MAG: CNNM domain-containing protein [Kiritimatiellia bacterium]
MIFIEISIYLICLLGSTFFAGIETGVIAINRLRLRHMVEEEEDLRARLLEWFLTNPIRLIGTTLVGNNICNVVLSIIGTRIGHRLPFRGGEALAEVITVLVVLIFCEYLPKAWFQSNPLDRCRPFAGLLFMASRLLKPLADAFTWASMFIVKGVTGSMDSRHPFVTRDEIGLLAKESAEHGVLSSKQRIMIHRVVELAGKTVDQVMVPRDKMAVIDSQATAEEFLIKARQANFTRLPVWDAQQDKCIGIANLFDVLSSPPTRYTENITNFMRPPQFLKVGTLLTEVLPRLRHSCQPLALVINAQEQAIGLLTTENILQHVVGTG